MHAPPEGKEECRLDSRDQLKLSLHNATQKDHSIDSPRSYIQDNCNNFIFLNTFNLNGTGILLIRCTSMHVLVNQTTISMSIIF